MRPGDTSMQGLRELGGELGGMPLLSGCLSDLRGKAGEVALHQASEGSSASEAAGRWSPADVEGVRTGSQLSPPAPEARISGLSGAFSACTTPGPDPVEHSSAWGEFEGFRESSAKSEQFSWSFELPERATAAQSPRPASHKQHGSQPPPQGEPWVTGTTAISPSEVFLKYSGSVLWAERLADLRPWWVSQGGVCSCHGLQPRPHGWLFVLPSQGRHEAAETIALGGDSEVGTPCAHPSSIWPYQLPASSAVFPSTLQPTHSPSTSCAFLALVEGTWGIGSLLR